LNSLKKLNPEEDIKKSINKKQQSINTYFAIKIMEDNYPSPMTSTWEEINEWARNFIGDFPKFDQTINDCSLQETHIHYFSKQIPLRISEFWLNINPKEACARSSYNEVFRIIDIHHLLSDYERDKALFHELCHLHYGGLIHPFLEDKFPYKRGKLTHHEEISENIIEWLGRKHRADYVLLREAVYSFELNPQIYDLPSYLAFAPLLDFNIEISNKKDLFRILMD